MLANITLPLFTVSPFYFFLIFPIICLFEGAVIIAYLNFSNDLDRVFISTVSANTISYIITISIIIVIEQISAIIGHEISYSETIQFLNNYKFIGTFCLLFSRILIEWLCLQVFFRKIKINRIKVLTGVIIANAISHLVGVPIFYRYFL